MKKKQREAVFDTVKAALEPDFAEGQRAILSKEQRSKVISKLIDGFQKGKIELGTSYEEKDLRGYASSLLNNWLRKDPRLNGGTKYAPKNPGSRAGQSDDQVKALRMLLRAQESQGADQDTLDQIQAAIDERVSSVRKDRSKPIDVDYSKIPADVLKKLGIDVQATA
jgi:hypothetical protein